ncbi:MAG: hypothetical protein AB4042_15425 [Leptolyngbyaceae cyanobacterium]
MSQPKSHRPVRQSQVSQSSLSGSSYVLPARRSRRLEAEEELIGAPIQQQRWPSLSTEHDVASHAITHDIQAITHYLRDESPLLDLVAIDLYQHLIERYGAELDQEMTSDTILTTLKNWAREQCDRHNRWVQTAEGISASLVAKAIQAMERDLGDTVLESLDWNEFNQILFQYLFEHPATPIKQRLEPLEQHYAQLLSQEIVSELDLDHQPISSLKRNLGLVPHIAHTFPLLGQTLSHVGPIPEIASEMPLLVGEDWEGDLLFSDQFQADLWASDAREVAYLRYHSKQRRHQYLEHYLTAEADIDSLPWDGIAQILTKFGSTAAKVHMLLLAYSAQQTDWWQPFTVTIEQLVRDMGWTLSAPLMSDPTQAKHPHLGRPKLRQSHPSTLMPQTKVTNVLYALSCILVKVVRVEHGGDRSIMGQTPVGKLWDLVIAPSGEFDWQTGDIETATHVQITVRPGLWIEALRQPLSDTELPPPPDPNPNLHSEMVDPASDESAPSSLGTEPSHYSHIQQPLRHCGQLAHQLLRLSAYPQDLAIRMIVHLLLQTQTQASDDPTQPYSVQALLEAAVPPAKLARAKTSIKHGQQLFESWNQALTILAQLQWSPESDPSNISHSGDRSHAHEPEPSDLEMGQTITAPNITQFYAYPYPKWLSPRSTMRKPRGWVQTWLEQTVQIRSDINTLDYL